MDRRVDVDLSTGFYESDSRPFANQRCVNFRPNIPDSVAVSGAGLWGVEGLVQIGKTGTRKRDACRGMLEFQGKAYTVNNGYLYEIEQIILPAGGVTYQLNQIGFIGGNTERVSMAENGDQLMIISDGEGYIYQPTASPAFQQISDPGFMANGTPKQVVYIDRYFVVTTDQKVAIISAVGDGFSWNSLDKISAEADPDAVVAPLKYKGQLYLLGAISGEQYANIGGAGVPFQRVNQFILSQGCSAPFSVINVGDFAFWVGRGENQKPVIWAFTGGSPSKISTKAIENKLHELSETDVSKIYSFAYSQRGNQIVAFTTANNTFEYNLLTGRWNERSSRIVSEGIAFDIPSRISDVVSVYNELIVGDTQDGRVGIIDEDEFTEYGEPLISWFTTQPFYDQNLSFSLPYIELFCESGVGRPDADLNDPQARMQVSRDGEIFEDPISRSLGPSGARRIRQIWRKNGRCNRLSILKFTISDAVKRRIYSLVADIRMRGF